MNCVIDGETFDLFPIEGFPNYWVEPINGRIYNITKGTFLKQNKKSTGYYEVSLSFQGKKTDKKIHQLVLSAIEPKPTSQHTVDHIDHDTSHNSYFNLRWATQSEQLRNTRPELRSNWFSEARPIRVFGPDMPVEGEVFPSMTEIERQLNIPHTSISVCLNHPDRRKGAFVRGANTRDKSQRYTFMYS